MLTNYFVPVIMGSVPRGGALALNGVNQGGKRVYISSATDNFTISQWVRLKAYPSSVGTLFMNGRTDAGAGYLLRITNTGELKGEYSFVAYINSGITIPLNIWTHIGLIRASGTSQCFFNGVRVGGTSSATPFTPNSYCTLGCDARGDTGVESNFATIDVDETRFYERALTNAEILALYNYKDSLTDISNANLRASWKLEEGFGATAVDSTANALDMTLLNSPLWIRGIIKK